MVGVQERSRTKGKVFYGKTVKPIRFENDFCSLRITQALLPSSTYLLICCAESLTGSRARWSSNGDLDPTDRRKSEGKGRVKDVRAFVSMWAINQQLINWRQFRGNESRITHSLCCCKEESVHGWQAGQLRSLFGGYRIRKWDIITTWTRRFLFEHVPMICLTCRRKSIVITRP